MSVVTNVILCGFAGLRSDFPEAQHIEKEVVNEH